MKFVDIHGLVTGLFMGGLFSALYFDLAWPVLFCVPYFRYDMLWKDKHSD